MVGGVYWAPFFRHMMMMMTTERSCRPVYFRANAMLCGVKGEERKIRKEKKVTIQSALRVVAAYLISLDESSYGIY